MKERQSGSRTAAARRAVLGALAAAGLVALAASGGALAQTRGGTAILAIDSDPETLNPGLTTGYSAGDVAAKIFEGLVWIDADGEPQPSLATAWRIADDGLTYTFSLRPNVTWHDGRPFTAEDVAFTFNEVLAQLHPRTSTTLKRLKAEARAVDAGTVTITLAEPFAPFMRQMWVFDSPILPAHLFAGTDVKTNPANQAPVGTGPFRLASWNRGSDIRVERNPSYWDAGKPYLDAIVFQVVPQAMNRTAGLETGEIDLVVDFYLPKAEVPRLLANPQLQSKRGRTIPAIYFLMVNTKRAPFTDVRARQALAHAIDRERLVAQAMNGLARPGAGAFGDGFPWLVNEDVAYAKLYPLDPARGRALIGEAGGAAAPLRLVYDTARPQMAATAQIVRENLRAIGLEVTLEPLERSVAIAKVFKDRDFDLTLQSYFSSGDPAIGYHRLYLTNETDRQFTNASGFGTPEVDGLLARAATAADRAERARLYKELQVILNRELPSVVLFDEDGVDFASVKLEGLWTSVDSRDRFGEVSMRR